MAKPDLAWREVTRWVSHPGWWELTLECGHEVRRPARIGRPAPRRVSCAECLRTVYLYVKFEGVGRAGLTPDQVLAASELMILELALVESLVLVHGQEAGIRRYYETGGMVMVDAQGSPWVPVTPGGVTISRPA